MTLYLIGLLVLASWAGVCFWLAARYQRRCIARGVRPNRNNLSALIAAGAGCAFMTFYLLFEFFNPPPPSIGRP